MSTRDKVAIAAAVIIGAALGYEAASVAGAIMGVFTGLGVLVVVYWIADEVDARLADHYASK